MGWKRNLQLSRVLASRNAKHVKVKLPQFIAPLFFLGKTRCARFDVSGFESPGQTFYLRGLMANTGRGIKSSHASAKRITRGSRAATGGIETWTRNVHLASRHSLALFPLSILIRKFYLTRNPIRVTFNVRTIFSNYERHAIARVCIPSRRQSLCWQFATFFLAQNHAKFPFLGYFYYLHF